MGNTSNIIIAAALLLSSCCSRTIPQRSEKRDSVRVVHETQYTERLRDTVIYVQLPAESRETEIQSDSSTLETSIACSRARINPDGTLYHTLENKSTKLPAHVGIKDTNRQEKRDIIVYRDNYVSDTIAVKHIPKSYWWFMGIAILSVAFYLYKFFRSR